jgi:Recombination, repair and ssDNA binding protein UvsY
MSKYVAPNLDELISEWEKDAIVDTTKPQHEMIRIPVLHSKYNKYLSLHKLQGSRRESEFYKMKKNKWMYYNGKLSEEELRAFGWEPFRFTLKADLNTYLDSDDDLIKLKSAVTFHDECVSYCTYVMKELNNRTWQLKEFMGWERFERGN